jgi:hypothetical protein
MTVLMSLKSKLTRPGLVTISVIPLMLLISTSSATLKAAFSESLGTISMSLSFGMTMTVSATLRSLSRPHSAFSCLTAPSAANG